MFDHAFTLDTLRSQVRSIDFFNDRALLKPDILAVEVERALAVLQDSSLLTQDIAYNFRNRKPVARATTFRTKLALRKVDRNLQQILLQDQDDRETVVKALRATLSEGVNYHLYRLDIRGFFESFKPDDVKAFLRRHRRINGETIRVVEAVIDSHASMHGQGLPRGLSISSTLSEAMLGQFDSRTKSHHDVFFYRRYVDDIVIVTSEREDAAKFVSDLESTLPCQMNFKRGKKHYVFATKTFRPAKHAKAGNSPVFKTFDYLGYCFNVAVEKHRPNELALREVWLDIASNKVAKIKTRLIRSFLDFIKTRDFQLLERRLRHLTSNLSLLDRSKGVRRLVGIHYNYPLVDYTEAVATRDLDRFLQGALSSTKGRVFRKLSVSLSPAQRQRLARYSFTSGAKGKHFFQMGVKELGRVQRCWKHA